MIPQKRLSGILRKSPTKDTEENIEDQKKRILARVNNDYEGHPQVHWFSDICEGDNEEGRKSLFKFLNKINEYERAYCINVDRWSRSWHGLKWFHDYFIPSGCQLHFVEECPNLYDKEGKIIGESYLFFFQLHGFANYWLMKIRTGRRRGIDRVLANPELRKEKYPGRPKGAKNKKPKKAKPIKVKKFPVLMKGGKVVYKTRDQIFETELPKEAGMRYEG